MIKWDSGEKPLCMEDSMTECAGQVKSEQVAGPLKIY
jgi:hypothetical protein